MTTVQRLLTVHYQFTPLSLTGLLQGHGSAAFLHHLPRDLKLLQLLLAGQVEHQVKHQFFQNHAQPASPHLAGHSLPRDRAQSLVAELQPHILELKQPLVLLDDGILRPREDLDQRKFVQIFQHADNRQPSDELRNQAELDQIFRLNLTQQFEVALARDGEIFLLRLLACAEAQRLLSHAPSYDLFQANECAAANEEDVGGVDRSEFLVRMLASALRRNIRDGPFQNLQ